MRTPSSFRPELSYSQPVMTSRCRRFEWARRRGACSFISRLTPTASTPGCGPRSRASNGCGNEARKRYATSCGFTSRRSSSDHGGCSRLLPRRCGQGTRPHLSPTPTLPPRASGGGRDEVKGLEAERVAGAAGDGAGVAVLRVAPDLREWVARTADITDRAGRRRVFVIEGAVEVRRIGAALAHARVGVRPEAAVAGPCEVDDDIGDQGRGLAAATAVTDRTLQPWLAAGGAADEVSRTLHIGGGGPNEARPREGAGPQGGRNREPPAAGPRRRRPGRRS